MALPEVISDYLVQVATRNTAIAYLHTTATGNLLNWGGDLKKYGLTQLSKGDYIGEHIFYIDGFFPFEQPHEVLPHIQTEQDLTVDIHLISEQSTTQANPPNTTPGTTQATTPGNWVLLIDATDEVEEKEVVQQQDNDLSLLRSQYQKLIGSHLNHQVAIHPSPQTLQAHKPANHIPAVHREMSILAIKVCQLEALSDRIDPADMLSILSAYVSFTAQAVVESGGVMNHTLGDVIVASFGLLPSTQSSAQQAVAVAAQLIKAARQSPPLLLPPYLPSPLAIGSTITSGRVAVGLLKGLAHPTLGMLGTPMQQALQLSPLIHPNTILADASTVTASGTYQGQFEPMNAEPMNATEARSWNLPLSTPLFSVKL